ncbi:hypothetical protein BJV74DRAFT_794552 [Russula compacta]|nr:hypothetical protein BJV74DRAFT_794552 [Russula compacta]
MESSLWRVAEKNANYDPSSFKYCLLVDSALGGGTTAKHSVQLEDSQRSTSRAQKFLDQTAEYRALSSLLSYTDDRDCHHHRDRVPRAEGAASVEYAVINGGADQIGESQHKSTRGFGNLRALPILECSRLRSDTESICCCASARIQPRNPTISAFHVKFRRVNFTRPDDATSVANASKICIDHVQFILRGMHSCKPPEMDFIKAYARSDDKIYPRSALPQPNLHTHTHTKGSNNKKKQKNTMSYPSATFETSRTQLHAVWATSNGAAASTLAEGTSSPPAPAQNPTRGTHNQPGHDLAVHAELERHCGAPWFS